jgi:hypothetical protein
MQPREFHYRPFKVKARERLRALVTGQSTLVIETFIIHDITTA